ncbi:unnamed protein product, partial [Ectocarpus sp. 12 AP-2014]
IACGSGGIYQAVPDGGSLSTAMSFYYSSRMGLAGDSDSLSPAQRTTKPSTRQLFWESLE